MAIEVCCIANEVSSGWEIGWEMVTALGTALIGLATVLGLVGIYFSRETLKLAKQQLLTEQEKQSAEAVNQRKVAEERLDREQKSRAIDLIVTWSTTVTKEMVLARKIGNLLDEKGAMALAKSEECTVSATALAAAALLLHKTFVPTDGRIRLDVPDVIELRSYITRYLNLLEAILLAWQHNSADREMLATEFKFFVLGNGDMKRVREAFDYAFDPAAKSPQTAYPAIAAFIKAMTG